MGRSSLPFSVCMVWNLCILFRRKQILHAVRVICPEDSSELQSKIGILNDLVHESLFALAKPRASDLGRGTLIFYSPGGSISRAVLWHRSWESLVSDAIRNFLTQLGWRFSNALKTQFPFSACRPLSIGSSLVLEAGKIHSFALEEM